LSLAAFPTAINAALSPSYPFRYLKEYDQGTKLRLRERALDERAYRRLASAMVMRGTPTRELLDLDSQE